MTYNQPTARPLPATLPEYILVEVYLSEYRGREQWVAEYRLAYNGKASDYLKVVVNFRRHQRPSEGLWWVKPTTMAPHLWLVFAEAYAEASDYRAPPPVRTGDELVLLWGGNENQRVAHRDGWTFRFGSVCPLLFDDELWRVQVERIDPSRGYITVSSLGPDPRAVEQLTRPIGYVGIYSLDGELLVEGNVCYSHFEGGAGRVDGESELGRPFQVKVEYMRRHNNRLIGSVLILKDFQSEARLAAELVLIEGPPVPFASNDSVVSSASMRTISKPPFEVEDSDDRDHYDDDIVRREEIENSERPEVDYDPEDVERYIYGADED